MAEFIKSSRAAVIADVVRWAARLSSVASIAVLLLFIFSDRSRAPNRVEILGLALFPGTVIVGLLLGWWREEIGALVATVGVIGIYVWLGAVQGRFPAGPWFLVFWSPAVLFFVSWLLRRSIQGGEGRESLSL